MKSGLRKLINQNAPVPYTSQGMYQLPPFMGGSGSEVFMRTYGQVGTVFSIVSLLAQSTARPEWRLYRQNRDNRVRYSTGDTGSDQRVEVLQHAALSLISKPNPYTTRFQLFEQSQQYLDLTGESPWLLEYDSRANFPIGIWPVRPDRLEAVPDRDTFIRGYVYTSPDGLEKIPFKPNEVIFAKLPNPLDPYHGLGPVQSILVDIDSSRYSAEWNRNFFVNSAIPNGVVSIPTSLSDEEFDEMSERWREAHRGVGRAHRVAFLENGATWVPTQMSMRDMDFTNLRNVGRDIIREAFAMHKVMLGVSDDVNRANAQTGEEVFQAWQVVPRLERWKMVLNEMYLPLFGSTGQGVEFDYATPRVANREQDNAELTTKANAASVLIQAGFDPHDVLEVVGLPDMDFGAAAALPNPPPAQGPEGTPDAPDAEDDMVARLRKVLSNGHLPVTAGRS